MKIIIDARMYGLEHAGIGRYVANLVCNVSAKGRSAFGGKSTEFILLVRENNYEEIRRNYGGDFKVVVVEAPHYSLKEQILLPFYLWRLKPDLVHFPHFNVPVLWFGKCVVTIHDLIKHISVGMGTTTRWLVFYWVKYLAYRFILRLAIKRAAKVIVPSSYWKNELIKRYGLIKEKVVVTYEGTDPKFKVQSARQSLKVLEKYKIQKPFVIYTGSLYPHKNVERLAGAIRKINSTPLLYSNGVSRTALSLVVASVRNVFYERFLKKIGEAGCEQYVNLVGFVSDEDLAKIYQEAECFVFPSLVEGFGLPGLEAMASGLPVVSSNSSCLPEIYGNAALYFDPLDIDDMAEKIYKVISDKKLRSELVKKGFERVKMFSWQKMAKETMNVYSEVLLGGR